MYYLKKGKMWYKMGCVGLGEKLCGKQAAVCANEWLLMKMLGHSCWDPTGVRIRPKVVYFVCKWYMYGVQKIEYCFICRWHQCSLFFGYSAAAFEKVMTETSQLKQCFSINKLSLNLNKTKFMLFENLNVGSNDTR